MRPLRRRLRLAGAERLLMPRRFAVALFVVLLAVLSGFLAFLLAQGNGGKGERVVIARPTSPIPPTPIPPKRVVLYFESPVDELLHPETRDLPAAPDEVAFLRAIVSAVLEGPRRQDLLKPLPDRWTLRAAFRLRDLAVLDLEPQPAQPDDPASASSVDPKWRTGTHEEEAAIQALILSIARNIPEVRRLVLLVGGEPAETLGGHLDISHPLAPDSARLAEENPGDPPATPTAVPATPSPSPSPSPAPTSIPSPRLEKRPRPPTARA